MNSNSNLMRPACAAHTSSNAVSNAPYLTLPTLSNIHSLEQGITGGERANLKIAIADGKTEIRAIQKTDLRPAIWSGIFDNYESLRASAKFAEQNGFDVYLGLNPSDLPVTNDIKPFRKTVKDHNVTRIRRLLFDLDPIRESGTAATDVQVGHAWERAERLMKLLAWGNLPDRDWETV